MSKEDDFRQWEKERPSTVSGSGGGGKKSESAYRASMEVGVIVVTLIGLRIVKELIHIRRSLTHN